MQETTTIHPLNIGRQPPGVGWEETANRLSSYAGEGEVMAYQRIGDQQ